MSTFVVGKVLRLEDADVRNATSPTDLLLVLCKDVVLVSSAADIDLYPYLPNGSKVVSYWFAKQATSTFVAGVSNKIATAAAVAGAAVTVDVLVIVEANKTY